MNATIKTATYGSVVGSKVKKEELVFSLPDLPMLTLVLVLLLRGFAVLRDIMPEYLPDLARRASARPLPRR